MSEQPPETAPEPLARGRFSLYVTPSGGYHIAFVVDGTDETRHIEVPGAAIKMAEKLTGIPNPIKKGFLGASQRS